ncbi:MAG: hypothetical protein HN542_03200 [Flavobacteriales bacterium]|nr:hypothetical protein [Flavobacteriales bacterium]MBT3964235.1 hypothetical protein [Flavobacteriales bacterium]MBT4704132.1 hypothetical protein [Flavobacteriales bacterium]MBT4930048.1 hypothetical protein [Flavobacteriales bacterium]MBT5132422.1 hypothetical protein [Flavobacteriales bacterium]
MDHHWIKTLEENILNTIQVDTILTSLDPPTIEIFAYGLTRTSGWTNGKLIPHIYLMPPEDGIYSFDFVANIPELELKADSRVKGLSEEFVRGVTAIFTWEHFPSELTGIRVYAQRNSLKSYYTESTHRITA